MDEFISKSTIIKNLSSKKKGFEDCFSNTEVKLIKEWNKAVDECISGIQNLPEEYNMAGGVNG